MQSTTRKLITSREAGSERRIRLERWKACYISKWWEEIMERWKCWKTGYPDLSIIILSKVIDIFDKSAYSNKRTPIFLYL